MKLRIVLFVLLITACSNNKADQELIKYSKKHFYSNKEKVLFLGKVKEAISDGADIEATDKNGVTPLGWACFTGHYKIIKLLISKGANVNSKDEDGVTPIMAAAAGGNKKIIELLLSKGANINAIDNQKLSALLRALINGKPKNAICLIKNKANINIKDSLGNPPLFIAAKASYINVIKELLTHGVKITVKNSAGIGVIQFVKNNYWKGSARAITFLKKNGATE